MKRRFPEIYTALTLLAAFCLLQSAAAQDTKYAGSFLELGIGARAMGMGGAYVSVADDGSAFFWNPAGVSTLVRSELFGMYASLFKSLEKHFHVGFSRPLYGAGAISFNWVRLTVPEIARYDSENLTRYGPNGYGARIEESSTAETWQELQQLGTVLTDLPLGFSDFKNDAFIITLSKLNKVNIDFGWQYFVLPVTIPLGFNIKLIRQSLFNFRSSGVGFDFGGMIRFGIDDLLDDARLGKFSMGFTYKDLWNTKLTWDTDSRHSDRIRRNWALGASYLQPLPKLKGQLLFAYALQRRYENTHHLGMEYLYFEKLAIRFGIDNSQFTAGVGIKLSIFRFDYAFRGHDLGSSHRISTAVQL